MQKLFTARIILLVITLGFQWGNVHAQINAMYYLEDVRGTLTPDSLTSPKWQNNFVASTTKILSFGFNSSYYWVRLQPALANNQTYILECNTPFVQNIDLYKFSSADSTWQISKGGYDVLWKDKEFKHRFPAFQLQAKDVASPIYLRIKNNGLSFPINLSTTNEFEGRYLSQHLFFGFLTGILFFVLFLNINLAASLDSRVHLFYSILLIGYLVFSLAGDGYLIYVIKDIPWLSRNYNSFSNVIEAYTYTAIVLYGIILFRIPKSSPWFWAFGIVAIFWTIHILNYNDALLSSILVEWGSSLVFVFSILLGARGVILKHPGASIYLLAYVVYFIFSLAQTAQYHGYIDHIFPVSYIVLGSQVEALILGYGLTRVTAFERNSLKTAKEKAENENIALIQNQNIKLEKLVEQKTQELQAANEELIASNEELISQHDEISAQRKYVEELNHTIANHNQELETEVRMRTGKLIEYNQQLEQFAFITAHNLRAPVARILGLANVMELEKTEAEKAMLAEKIIQSCKDLDAVIHDINTILVIRNDHDPKFDTILLHELLNTSLLTLQTDIAKTQTKLEADFTVPTVEGITPYLQSIFTNLIHNAIKYKHPYRDPVISIQSKKLNGGTEIKVSDNGIGIDLEKHGDKVFGLYKRFHTHTEGRGMGLFLVKNQIEAMMGAVFIDSTPDVGTTFTLYLPDAKK